MYDILLTNGFIVDGTGNPWIQTNIAIENGKIVKIGKLESQAEEVIDAHGFVVCPGFIDMHSHSDWTVIVNPLAESKIRQGVTTEVTGNCGISGHSSTGESLNEINKKNKETYDIEINWKTLEGYKELVEKQGVALNVAPLAGLGTISTSVIGNRLDGPNKDELQEMKILLDKAMMEGAFGASNGRDIYDFWAKRCDDRLIELVSVLRKYDGLYSTHMKNEGDYVIDAVLEEIEICERAGVRLHISHHKHNGYENFGTVGITLRLMNQARKRGLDVTLDHYPYTATGGNLIKVILPPWIRRKSFEERRELLKDPDVRKRIKREILTSTSEGKKWYSQLKNSATGDLRSIIGEEAISQCRDQFDYAFDLLMEEENIPNIRFAFSEDDVKTVMKNSITMFGSDGSALAQYGILSKGKPHPRNYGTFPRILGKYVREDKTITLEEAIRKMTSLPAQTLGIKDRGMMREGMWADIVIFDPLTVRDKATYEGPQQYPEGIEYVIVNGKIVIAKGEHQKVLPGKVLQHKY
jgi:N-acyl-D-amino-acid deacylase